MSLEEYARKRSFRQTPEPAPSPSPWPAPPGSRFCVQRHHARRLHYDFRLEIGGALKSWAIPHGPTLDPSQRRLAVMVEDHPLDYGDFEGTIPTGNYGAGSVMLWDRGTFELLGGKSAEEQLDRGDLKFRLHGEKLHGDFALVRMRSRAKANEWLLLKKRDDYAQPGWDTEAAAYSVLTGRTQEEIAKDMPARETQQQAGRGASPAEVAGAVRAKMPAQVTPMLAVAADQPPAGDDWLYEIKWDGIRALCFIEPDGLRLRSRKGTSIDRQYPELSVLPHYVDAKTAILDGEIAVLDEAGRPSFAAIQPRIMAADANAIAQLARKHPVTFFVFDLLYLDGYDLRESPLAARKQLLASLLRPNPVLRYSEHFEGNAAELLAAARAKDLEGLVAKKASSRYHQRRSRDWLKIKVTHDQEFVICGYTEGERDYFGALLLGVYDKGELVFAGNVGTGFNRKLAQQIHALLQPLVTEDCPFAEAPELPQPVTWVRPESVCTVRYNSWTGAGRLRAPVFVGMRPDADPRDCWKEPAEPESAPFAPRPPLLAEDRATASVKVEGRPLHFRNLDKLFYPAERYTKRDVINYYDAVAGLLLPHLRDRPLSLKRYPDGIEREYFFQKNAARGFPSWMRTELISEDGEAKQFVIGADRPSLLYLANLGCIDQNPWMSRSGSLANPDFVLIDLDAQDCGYDRIVEAALVVRRKLDQLGLESYPKTTGGDGMHLYVPVELRYTYDQTRTFAEILARLAAAERPDLFTTPRPVAQREKGKVYFDYLQNGKGKTISAPYVLRPYPGAPVATPLDWGEVAPGLLPAQFHLRNVLERFERVGDLFAGVLARPQRLEPAMEKLEALVRPGSV